MRYHQILDAYHSIIVGGTRSHLEVSHVPNIKLIIAVQP